MKRILWFTLALIGVVALTAACDPFGTPAEGDIVLFETCPTATCEPDETNILIMKDPVEVDADTVGGLLQLRLTGRDGAVHNHHLQGTITGDDTLAGDATHPEEWSDAFGVTGLDLADVAVEGVRGADGDWNVTLIGEPTLTEGTPAADLAPPLIPLLNSFDAAISDPEVPLTAGVRLGTVDLAGYHFDDLEVTKTTWADRSDIDAVVHGAAATIGGVALSDVDATINLDETLAGHITVQGNVASGATVLPVTVDLPVHFEGLDIVAGPDATISIGAGGGIALTGTFTVGGIIGDGPTTVSVTDATLDWAGTQIPVSAEIVADGDGIDVELHAGTAQLTPGILLHDADLTWHDGTLGVHASADLDGDLTAEGVSVDGTATITGGTPAVALDVTADRIAFELADTGTIDLADVAFHLGGDFDGGTVNLTAALALDHGTVGGTTVAGDLSVTGKVALGDSFTVRGWRVDLDADVSIGSVAGTAAIHGSGGSLYDGSHGGVGCVSVPVGVGTMFAQGAAGPAATTCDAADVTAVIDIVDPGNGIGGVLRAEVWMDGQGRLHIEAAGNAHLTVGSKVAVDGAVQISDNVIHLAGDVKFGTKLQAPVMGTVTIDPQNPTAVPTVDIAVAEVHLTEKLWLDDVHITNTGDLTHFSVTGRIDNTYGAKTLGLVSLSKRFGALNIDGSVDLGAANLTDPATTNIAYDLSITAPDAVDSSPLLWLFYANTNDFDFHVWGDSHTAHLSLGAEATLFAGVRPLGAGANIHVGANGSVNLDTGAVAVIGNAEADAFVNLGLVADGSADANVQIVLTGNIDSQVSLTANGYGTFSANALGFVPIASGDGELHGNVSISMGSGAISGSADFAYGINVVGGLFGNDDGDWHYNLSGTVYQPVVTAHDSYTRHNHHKGENISGQVYPVRNLCGQAYRKKKFLGIGLNWVSDGQWGDCAATGHVEGRVLVDTDGSGSATGADTPLPEGTAVAVTITDSSDGGALVGQATTGADGSFSAPVVVRPGHTYRVNLSVPAGYTHDPGTAGYVPSSGGTVAAPGAGQTRDAGTFGVAPRRFGSITGVVFDDANGNGVRDVGEPGIPGVTVTVAGRTAISGPGGHYDMNLLDAPSTVTVTVSAPSGSSVTADPDGTVDGTTQVQVAADTTTTVGAFGLCSGTGCTGVVGPFEPVGPVLPGGPLIPIDPVGPVDPTGPDPLVPLEPVGSQPVGIH